MMTNKTVISFWFLVLSVSTALVSPAFGGMKIITSGGTGNMTKAVYDPLNIAGDIYNVDNHVSGTTNKVYTATEQTKLAGIQAGAQANVAIASQTEAEAGTETTKTMTPQRVLQAMTALGYVKSVTDVNSNGVIDKSDTSGGLDGNILSPTTDFTVNMPSGKPWNNNCPGTGTVQINSKPIAYTLLQDYAPGTSASNTLTKMWAGTVTAGTLDINTSLRIECEWCQTADSGTNKRYQILVKDTVAGTTATLLDTITDVEMVRVDRAIRNRGSSTSQICSYIKSTPNSFGGSSGTQSPNLSGLNTANAWTIELWGQSGEATTTVYLDYVEVTRK